MSRIKTSDILKRAKPYLWDGSYPIYKRWRTTSYLCYAICNGNPRSLRRSEILNRISQSIHPFANVEDWLTSEHGIEGAALSIQQYRHRWLDSLIKEYEAKGD